ncbi:hypothetical protein BH11PAT2_BH11PAT2_08190 [soil metagenome]
MISGVVKDSVRMVQALALVQPKSISNVVRPPLAVLPSFGLSRIVARISKENPDWSQDRIQAAEDGYREFLAKAKAQPGGANFPTADVDKMWHAHILFTKQYHADCLAYFGYYLHHEPFDETNRPAKANDDCGADSCTSCGPGTITVTAVTCESSPD